MGSYDGMNPQFRQQLSDMIAASGGRIWLTSGYRSSAEQAELYAAAVAKYGEAEAGNWAAPPGRSKHGHGLAADIGGDWDWLKANAAAFGLWLPMDWEPWHVELAGSRDGQENAMDGSTLPPSERVTNLISGQLPQRRDPISTFARMLGMDMDDPTSLVNQSFLPSVHSSIPAAPIPGLDAAPAPPAPTRAASGDDIDRFMAAIRAKESSGDYSAVGQPTPWGRATGAYQFLDSTWGNYKGYSRAMDAPAHIQDERARDLMLEYYNQFGNWSDVASAWYSGPGGNFQSGEVRSYSTDVMGRMYG